MKQAVKIFAIQLMLSLSLASAIACDFPPPEQITPAPDLVKRTKTIVLARVISAEYKTNSVDYTFQTISAQKGTPSSKFTISGESLISGDWLTTYNHHTDERFWGNHFGRSPNYPDCEIHPSFSVGATFLVFLERPYHIKSFELIIRTHGDKKDAWLKWVEDQVHLENTASEVARH
jgi:hypothetical protein